MTTSSIHVTTLRIPRDLYREVKLQARKEGRSAANLMLYMMREGLKRQRKLFLKATPDLPPSEPTSVLD